MFGRRRKKDLLLAKEIATDYQLRWEVALSRLKPGEVLTNRTWPKVGKHDHQLPWIHPARRQVLARFPDIRSVDGNRYERRREDGQWPSDIERRKRTEEEAARKLLVRQPLDRRVEQRVMQEGGGMCAYCGGFHRSLEIDHIIPWSVSHDNSYDNLVVACRDCNRSKGAKSGHALRSWLRRVNCAHPKVMAAAGRAV